MGRLATGASLAFALFQCSCGEKPHSAPASSSKTEALTFPPVQLVAQGRTQSPSDPVVTEIQHLAQSRAYEGLLFARSGLDFADRLWSAAATVSVAMSQDSNFDHLNHRTRDAYFALRAALCHRELYGLCHTNAIANSPLLVLRGQENSLHLLSGLENLASLDSAHNALRWADKALTATHEVALPARAFCQAFLADSKSSLFSDAMASNVDALSLAASTVLTSHYREIQQNALTNAAALGAFMVAVEERL